MLLRHGSGYRQRFDPPKETGSGAAHRPAVDPQAAEKPQQKQGALQRKPGRYLLQSENLRPQEEKTTETRCESGVSEHNALHNAKSMHLLMVLVDLIKCALTCGV